MVKCSLCPGTQCHSMSCFSKRVSFSAVDGMALSQNPRCLCCDFLTGTFPKVMVHHHWHPSTIEWAWWYGSSIRTLILLPRPPTCSSSLIDWDGIHRVDQCDVLWDVSMTQVSLHNMMMGGGRGWGKTIKIDQRPFQVNTDHFWFSFLIEMEKHTFACPSCS